MPEPDATQLRAELADARMLIAQMAAVMQVAPFGGKQTPSELRLILEASLFLERDHGALPPARGIYAN